MNWGSDRRRGLGTSTAWSSEMRPVGEHEHPVGEQDRLVDVVGDQQHGRTVLRHSVLQQAVHSDPGERVERTERFVEQQQFGLADQGAGQCDPLRLSARQVHGQLVARAGQAHLGEHLVPVRAAPAPGGRA